MANEFQSEWDEPELSGLADLAENLVYRLSGCDDTTIRKTLQEVAREFVRETQALTVRQIVLPAAPRLYPVPVRFGGKVADVRFVGVPGGRELRRGVDWEVGASHPLEVKLLRPLAVSADGTDDRDPVRFTPAVNIVGEEEHPEEGPGVSHAIVVVSVEHLGMFSEKLPSEFLHIHGDAICAGTMARLCQMAQRPWSDPQVALSELQRYENAKSELRMRREAPRNGRFIDMKNLL